MAANPPQRTKSEDIIYFLLSTSFLLSAPTLVSDRYGIITESVAREFFGGVYFFFGGRSHTEA